jgi:hypothetical protein
MQFHGIPLSYINGRDGWPTGILAGCQCVLERRLFRSGLRVRTDAHGIEKAYLCSLKRTNILEM